MIELREEMVRVEKELSEVRVEAEDRLHRDRQMAMEEELAEALFGIPNLEVPSGLEFDFSGAPPHELGGGAPTFWAGSYADDLSLPEGEFSVPNETCLFENHEMPQHNS
jgi:hypothetical protein